MWRSYYKAAARFADALEAEASTLRQQLATHPQLLPRYLLVCEELEAAYGHCTYIFNCIEELVRNGTLVNARTCMYTLC
jgi:hypothetical protein